MTAWRRLALRLVVIGAFAFLACSLPATAAEMDDPAPVAAAEAEPGADPSAPAEAVASPVPASGEGAPEPTPGPPVDPGPGHVRILELEDVTINVGSSTIFREALAEAAADPACRLFVVVLDTPGGSLEETRQMVKAMLESELPIAVFVGPKGARAASAGVFLTMAAHVAGMAPATHIGAAHPVFLGGGGADEGEDPEKAKDSEAAMLEKVTNDTVAWVRGIARERGRNGDWAEEAVRQSVSIEGEVALDKKVVDLVAQDLDAFLAAADGKVVKVASGRALVLHADGPRQAVESSIRHRALMFVGNPNIAYLLLSLGMLLLWVEFKAGGGLVFAGLGGVLCLALAAIGMSILPVNLVAVLLVLLGVGLIIAEIYLPSFGVLTVLGVASLVSGGLFLIHRTPEFDVGVSVSLLGGVAGLAMLTSLVMGVLVFRGQQRPVQGGREGIVGEEGVVRRPIPGGSEGGTVFVHGELWQARSSGPVAAGTSVVVQQISGLMLDVEPAPRGPGGA